MLLYHGTSQTNVADILLHGLSPRYDAPGNWYTNVKSNRNVVYLTKSVVDPEHYALRSAIVSNSKQAAILCIDTDFLDAYMLRVDENFLDIESRGTHANCGIDERKAQRLVVESDDRWEESLAVFGACSHYGVIPAEAISVYKQNIDIRSIRYYRPEFEEHTDPTANCYVYDTIIEMCQFDNDRNTFVYEGAPLTRFIIDVAERHVMYANIDD